MDVDRNAAAGSNSGGSSSPASESLEHRLVVVGSPHPLMPCFASRIPLRRKFLCLLYAFGPTLFVAEDVQTPNKFSGTLVNSHYIFDPGCIGFYFTPHTYSWLMRLWGYANTKVTNVKGKLTLVGINAPWIANAGSDAATNSIVTMTAKLGKGLEQRMQGKQGQVSRDPATNKATNFVEGTNTDLQNWGKIEKLVVGAFTAGINDISANGTSQYRQYEQIWGPTGPWERNNAAILNNTNLQSFNCLPDADTQMTDIDLTESEGPLLGWDENTRHFLTLQPSILAAPSNEYAIPVDGVPYQKFNRLNNDQASVNKGSVQYAKTVVPNFDWTKPDFNNFFQTRIAYSNVTSMERGYLHDQKTKAIPCHHFKMIAPPTNVLNNYQEVSAQCILETECWLDIGFDAQVLSNDTNGNECHRAHNPDFIHLPYTTSTVNIAPNLTGFFPGIRNFGDTTNRTNNVGAADF